ncbi:MAG: fused MFS/spermidine synthase [Gemmatimonadota bacterium]
MQPSTRRRATEPPAKLQPFAAATTDQRYLPLMLLLFIGSGCAALIYEIVWLQSLSLIVGSNAISMGVVLGTFMGGMCIGSLLLPRYVKTSEHPLRTYAKLEAGIAVFGILILIILPYAGGLYTSIGGSGFGGLLVRGVFCAICLLPPTVLMGATLPAVARWVQATPQGVSWLGFFYGGNIGGAVLGCLLAGFYLLRLYDNSVATFAAVALNIAVALAGLALAGVTSYEPVADDPKRPVIEIPRHAWPVFVVIALSGATALGAEVVWTRLLTLLLGATTYTFSLILAAVLVGLGIGSSMGSFLARTVSNPRRALGWCQLGVVCSIGWAAYCETRALPYWPINPALSSTSWLQFQIDFVRALVVVLPASILWGASFPIALAAAAPDQRDASRLVGTVYAANTVGAIIGALVASLILVGTIGTQQSQRVLMALAAIGALIMLVPSYEAPREEGDDRPRTNPARGMLSGVVTVVLTLLLASTVIPVPAILVGYGRYAATWLNSHGEFIFVGEGMNSSMAVSRLSSGYLNYHNAGKVQASSEPQDMRLQRMLGHLTTLIPDKAKSVLVIGCGAGVTAGAVSISPAVERLTIAEIEPLVPSTVSTYFSEQNYSVVQNPKTHVRIDDARHFLLTTNEKFDAITSDPFDPWVKGAATLYSREFWEEAKKHLNPGGVVTVFVQLYEAGTPAVKSEMATFFEAFPDGVVFGNTFNGQGYDVVLVGQNGPLKINLDAVEARLAQPEYAKVRQSLAEIGFNSGVDLFTTFAGRASDLKGYLADAQVNRDRNLRLQYLAGLGANKYEQASIYADVLSNGRWVDGMFTGAEDKIAYLRSRVAVH